MNRTFAPKKSENLTKEWHFIDAKNRILGKVAVDIAKKLMGKGKSTYTRNMNVGDKVVVINAKDIEVTGNKLEDKIYYRHTGYPGGLRSATLGELMAKNPDRAIRLAVRGMLPKNKLQKVRMANLYVYNGVEHPHMGQVNLTKTK